MNNKQIEDEHNKMKRKMAIVYGIEDEFKIKAVGYLSIAEPCDVGKVPEGFIEKLKQIYHNGLLLASMGHHECKFCINQGVKKLPRDALSSFEKIIRDDVNKIEYIFPEMLFHYISVHQFKPPQEFINFIMKQ